MFDTLLATKDAVFCSPIENLNVEAFINVYYCIFEIKPYKIWVTHIHFTADRITEREGGRERENSNGQYGELFGKEPAINKSMELKDLLVTELDSFPIIMMVLVESIIFFLCNAITYK